MTKSPFPEGATYADTLGPAMKITDQDDADAYLEKLVAHGVAQGLDAETAHSNAKTNLGYYTGYYDSETAARVFGLFRCSHPVFGTRRDHSAEELIEAGKDMASS